MTINELQTPSFLLNLDVLENNLMKIQDLCNKNNKELWPMTKTHKSTEIAILQKKFGAKGFLVGTIDEASCLIDAGLDNIALAYPIISKTNIKRVIDLSKKAKIYLSFDGEEAAESFEEELKSLDLKIDYFIIINSGLNRLGVNPKDAGNLAKKLSKYKHLNLIGISTHPGHVYAVSNNDEISNVSNQEMKSLELAKESLIKNSFNIDIVATGSTPTFFDVLTDSNINVLRPGNYPFYDNIQISLGVCKEEDCSLSVLGTIISKPQDNLLIMDVGSKCLGLDKGAHASTLINGFGRIIGHPELEIIGLSEEVGKIKINSTTELKLGDKIQIIPNHSCSAANMTSYLVGFRNKNVEKLIAVDIRGNSLKPNLDF